MSKFKFMGILCIGLIVSTMSGCSSVPKQDSAIKNGVFYGNSSLSFGGNLELLAGNSAVEDKNDDNLLSSVDIHFIEASGDTVSAQTSQDFGAGKALDFLATAKLVGSGFALANFLSNPADYPGVGHVILIKLEDGQNPRTPEMLRKAFTELTNPSSALIQNSKCAMDGTALHCINAPKDSDIGDMRFSTLVDYSYVQKLIPGAEPGNYAAYGFDDAVWTTSQLRSKDLAFGNPYMIHFSAAKYWYTLSKTGSLEYQYTYRVTKLADPNLMGLIYIYNTDYKEKKIATLR